MKYRAIWNLGFLVLLASASGANCPLRRWNTAEQSAPTVFETQPTIQDIVRVVNTNRSLITSIYSTRASLSGTGFPMMRASLAVGSPRHLRLRAGTGITGNELDFGSNEQLFWVWVKRSQPPALYYGYHDRFQQSQIRHQLPVQPEWLIEAVGLVYLDPNGRHEGPFQRPDGKLEIRTRIPAREGDLTKSLVLDGRSGLIYEQHLFDAQGRLLASAYSSKHARDPATGSTLPRQSDIRLPEANMEIRVELNDLQINPVQLSPELWAKPEYSGFANVDITQGQLPGAPIVPMPTQTPPNAPIGQLPTVRYPGAFR